MSHIKIISLLLMMLLPTAVMAQEKVLVLDEASFAPIQTDALTGLNIDPIGKDRSQRACARLKIHIDRMTREEINDIQVIPMGGNVQLTERIVAIEGNGLIVEMTARPVTIYLKHPTLGESNPIRVNLEDNKEYRLEAWCNQLQSITIYCPKPGAEVYLDGEYKGSISADNTLGIRDVVPGDHTLKVQAGEDVTENKINVSSHNFSFNVELKSAALMRQFLVFNIEPKDALVELDGEPLFLTDGMAEKLVKFGRHTYLVEAKDYNSIRGEVIVNDISKKCEVNVKLTPSHGYITINTPTVKDANIYIDKEFVGKGPLINSEISKGVHEIRIIKPSYKSYEKTVVIEEGKTTMLNPILEADFSTLIFEASHPEAEIWINGENRGKGIWRGDLATGSYVIETKLQGYKPTRQIFNVVPNMSPAPNRTAKLEPIYGVLSLTSTPSGADVTLDGKKIGVTPQYLPQTLVGTHKIKITKEGYQEWESSVTIAEGELTEVNAVLDNTPKDEENGHKYVDLGLSVKWATCNVGASSPEEYGDYFAWGETSPKSRYSWSTYKYCNGTYKSMTKYCVDSDEGTVDNKTTLELSDDAAHVNWGGNWRMPTRAEQDELRNKCTWRWGTKNGVEGYTVTSKTNGNSIFLPAAGYRYGSSLGHAGGNGNYWSSSLNESYSYSAYYLYFGSGYVDWSGRGYRSYGRSVRAVCE